MFWSRKNRIALSVMAAALVSAVWFGLTLMLRPPSQWSFGEAASLMGLAAFVVLSGLFISGLAISPLRHTRQMVQALASGSLRERLSVSDVSEESNQIQLDLNTLMDHMEETMARQRQFVSSISHDLRTPLTIIKGDIEVALMRRRSPEEYEEVLQSNLEEVERIRRLVEDLVTLARADYGELGLNVRAVALGSLVDEVREALAGAAKRNELALESYVEGDVQIEGDQARLRQVLHNLIDNAIHYTLPGGKIEVALLSDRERDEVKIRVRDNGIGISARDLPHIFEPFYRGAPSRRTRHDGYGLGLAICDHIVRAHGGRVSVESRQGQGSGTTFTVNLPRRPLAQ